MSKRGRGEARRRKTSTGGTNFVACHRCGEPVSEPTGLDFVLGGMPEPACENCSEVDGCSDPFAPGFQQATCHTSADAHSYPHAGDSIQLALFDLDSVDQSER